MAFKSCHLTDTSSQLMDGREQIQINTNIRRVYQNFKTLEGKIKIIQNFWVYLQSSLFPFSPCSFKLCYIVILTVTFFFFFEKVLTVT